MITKINLSEDDSWKNIYEPYIIDNGIVLIKDKLDYSNQWNDVNLLSDLLKKLSLKFDKDSLKSVKIIGKLIDYQCEVEHVGDIINKCLAYNCHKNDFILKCIKFIKQYTDLQLYYIFNLAFYIYYLKFNKSKIINCDYNDFISFKKLTFEKNPELFGYDSLKQEINRFKNLDQSIKKMKNNIKIFFEKIYPIFLKINSVIESKNFKKADKEILKKEYIAILDQLKSDEIDLYNSIKDTDIFKEKKLYSAYGNVLSYFIYFIEKDLSVIDKYICCEEYGFFAKRKDKKMREKNIILLKIYIEKLNSIK